ncbi:MAG: heptosyltransferase-3 [Oceanicoccus sp.]|jgi:heptosyltransferase-3
MTNHQPINFNQIKRVLITKLRFHGDVLLASPVFQVLKEHYPQLEVDGLIYGETKDMLSLHPALDQLHCIDKGWKKQGRWYQTNQEHQLYQRLKARDYDLLIHLTEDWRGALLQRLLHIPFAVTADHQRRRNNGFWQNSFSHIHPLPAENPIIDTHLAALNALGILTTAADKQLRISVSEQDQQFSRQLLAINHIKAGEFISIHPTSRFFYKCWPPELMAQFIDQLTDRDIPVVLTAAPSTEEQLYIDKLMAALSRPVVNLSGQLSLKQLAAVIGQSRCFVGVDSAPMHIASATGVPLVALFGVTNAKIWAPVGDNALLIKTAQRQKKPARVNGERPNKIENCILNLSVDAVLTATLQQAGY